jgi:hypothetical protein
MGRGQNSQAAQAARRSTKTPTVDSDGRLQVRVEGQEIRDQVSEFSSPHTQLFISNVYSDGKDIAATLNQLFEETPKKLRNQALKTYVFDAVAPMQNGAMCVEQGELMIWRVPANDNRPGIRRDVLIHELAHLAGNDEGPPDHELWNYAREEDRQHGLRLLETLGIEGGALQVGEHRFEIADAWMRHPAIRGEKFSQLNEDWAEAVTYYLEFPRLSEGGLIINNYLVKFEDLWPFRAHCIKKFLSS